MRIVCQDTVPASYQETVNIFAHEKIITNVLTAASGKSED